MSAQAAPNAIAADDQPRAQLIQMLDDREPIVVGDRSDAPHAYRGPGARACARARRPGRSRRRLGLVAAASDGLELLVLLVLARHGVLELAHPASERLPQVRQPLGPEDHEHDDEDDDDLEWAGSWHVLRHGSGERPRRRSWEDASVIGAVLSDGTIRRLVDEGRIGIEPWDPEMVQPASVDLKLGRLVSRLPQPPPARDRPRRAAPGRDRARADRRWPVVRDPPRRVRARDDRSSGSRCRTTWWRESRARARSAGSG